MTGTDVRVSTTVVIPYLSRKTHLEESLNSWFHQDGYDGHLGVVVADFSSQQSSVDLSRVMLVRPVNTRWNISRARNIGARAARGDLLIFADASAVVSPNFLACLLAQWDFRDMWVCDSISRGVPYNPSLDSLIAVKRWVNTRIRGFNEPMMENPHGWGYDAIDYRLRAEAMLSTCGGAVGEFQMASVSVLPSDDASRVDPYDHQNIQDTYHQHASYSRWYRTQMGFEANAGQDWGQSW